MPSRDHHYRADVQWHGNTGRGTAGYGDYARSFRARIEGKPELTGSADAAFAGDPAAHNPEDLLLVALSACHMLTYLALCARAGICVLAYRDHCEGVLALDAAGSGAFREATLRPQVAVAASDHVEQARALHEAAHRACFIARSCRFPVAHHAQVGTLAAEGAA
ncbi:OsmC family protein [Dyella sp.]|uniref:OsmC family protein n=1 Tax=Dyella sp. TaxID=1869338 RepID=UPI002D78BDDF|nr:OsmC family protein [Dyella sp.]HET6432512.1 OsmC family protein [Dyella sp.]